jgi:hypothetical protein
MPAVHSGHACKNAIFEKESSVAKQVVMQELVLIRSEAVF